MVRGRERERARLWEGFQRVGESFDESSLRADHGQGGGEADRRGLDKDRPPFPLESHVLVYEEQRGLERRRLSEAENFSFPRLPCVARRLSLIGER